jgi:hypothetical protein
MSSTGSTADADQWASFCDNVKAAGMEILAAGAHADPLNKSEGLRYLTRILRGALEMYVEYSDPVDPVLFKRTNERLKYGFDNPDNIYSTCTVSDQHEYEIRGNRGSVSYLSINLSNSDTTGKMLLTAFLEDADLLTDAAGDFAVRLGGEPQSRNWLPLPKGTNTLMIRQSFLDRSKEAEARYSIRRLSPQQAGDTLSEAKARDNLERAEQWFCRTGRTMLGWANNLLPTVNELPPADQAYVQSLGADPRMYYYWSSWRIAPDEVLLIHLPELPASGMWSLCLSNLWLESLDYTQYRINFNSATAKQNPDGSVTLAIAGADPGIANWLNTGGHPQGNMMFRWTKADRIIHPRVELATRNSVNWESKLRRWT